MSLFAWNISESDVGSGFAQHGDGIGHILTFHIDFKNNIKIVVIPQITLNPLRHMSIHADNLLMKNVVGFKMIIKVISLRKSVKIAKDQWIVRLVQKEYFYFDIALTSIVKLLK